VKPANRKKLSSSRDLISLQRRSVPLQPYKRLSYFDLNCAANFPEARSGRERTLQAPGLLPHRRPTGIYCIRGTQGRFLDIEEARLIVENQFSEIVKREGVA
jgi:hypothetical protein